MIKKWLYSDHDIFYRELVSNGCDAITKLKKLELIGEYERPEDMDYKIQVSVNPNEKTIRVTDNGLGMTEDEIDKYINQIAFSGVQDFLEKYKDKACLLYTSSPSTAFPSMGISERDIFPRRSWKRSEMRDLRPGSCCGLCVSA